LVAGVELLGSRGPGRRQSQPEAGAEIWARAASFGGWVVLPMTTARRAAGAGRAGFEAGGEPPKLLARFGCGPPP